MRKRVPLTTRGFSADDVRAMLHEAGLRFTAPRLAVLELLAAADNPKSHAEVADVVSPKGFDKATVFRNLNDLAAAGLVTRTDLGDHVWRFELRREGDKRHAMVHPHFVCTDCGDVTCLPADAVRVKDAPGAPRAVTDRTIEVQVKGVCDTCAR